MRMQQLAVKDRYYTNSHEGLGRVPFGADRVTTIECPEKRLCGSGDKVKMTIREISLKMETELN
jgi:hypothetical protein